MPDSLNLSTLAAQAGDYFREHEQTLREETTIGLFEGPFSLDERFTLIDGITDELQLDSATVADFITQHIPSQAGGFYPPTNVIEPQARFLKMREYKAHLLFTDDQIRQTSLMYKSVAKQMARKNPETATADFIDYLFGSMIISKLKETLRKAIVQAVYNPTAPRSWTKILDGLEERIAQEVLAGTLTPNALSAVTPQNVVPQMETVFDGIGQANRSQPDMICAVSPIVWANVTRADLASLGRSDKYDGTNALTIAGYPNCKVKMEPFLQGTKVLVYPKKDAIVGTSDKSISAWEFQRQDETTKMLATGYVDFNFAKVNIDPANPNISYGEL